MYADAVKFTQNDLAKYPFLKETAQYIGLLNLQIEDLTSPGMEQILGRAEERIREAILSNRVERNLKKIDTEIFSYPVALLLVIATENSFIKKRYALAEAKQAGNDLIQESKEKILQIAREFDWKIDVPKESFEISSDFVLHFADYLRNTTHLRDRKWKLVNSLLVDGHVYLNKTDVIRLLEEEIRKQIEKRLDAAKPSKYPPQMVEIAERLTKLAQEMVGTLEMEGFPKVVVQDAFPPCINALYAAATSNRHLSHVGRFALVSFLVSVGMPPEKVTELFRGFSDFNERLTRYQVEHIAGERGSGTRYTPPNCETLQTHGVCVNNDDLCPRIRNPLVYYKLKHKYK